MSAIAQLEYVSDEIIYTLARRVIIYSMVEFDRVWESANRICDRYQEKSDQNEIRESH
jgi:hypothetical protein